MGRLGWVIFGFNRCVPPCQKRKKSRQAKPDGILILVRCPTSQCFVRSRQAGTSCDVSSVQRLELRTSCNESLTSLVSLILLEVLDEAGSEILSLLLPLSCVSISVAWVEDVGVYAVELCRNNEVEEWDSLCWCSVDRVVEDSVDDTTSVADRDTLAGTVPTSVHQVSLSTALLHLLNQLLSILCWVELQECLAEASRECRSRLCDATLCTSELCCESREEVVLCLLSAQDRYWRKNSECVCREEDNLLCSRALRIRTLDVLDVVDRIRNTGVLCYALVSEVDLAVLVHSNVLKESEPDIYNAIKRNALLENVTVAADGKIDFADKSVTENTRVSYPINHIENIVKPISHAPAAKQVIFLSADAFGVLPPVSILTPEQTKYYFLSGFTAKLAGTERGITEPTPTFSACFGQAFLELHPTKYAEELVKKMEKSGAKAYLVNTGWNGTGKRISIKDTRGIIDAILDGSINNAPTKQIPLFDFTVPTELPGVDPAILDPRDTYDCACKWEEKAKDLAGRFIKNFVKYTGNEAGKALVAAGPQL